MSMPLPNSHHDRDQSTVATLRVPPSSVDAEQSVLGGILLSPDSFDTVDAILHVDDFYRRDHRLIYDGIIEVRANGAIPDAVTVAEWLESSGHADIVSPSYLIELASNTPSAANIAAYANIVKEKSNLRRLIEAGTEIVNYGFAPDGQDAASVYHRSLSAITAIQPALTNDIPPTDLFGESNPPELKREWLPPPIQDLVFSASAVKGSPPEVMALSMLVACAAACDDRFQVQPRYRTNRAGRNRPACGAWSWAIRPPRKPRP